MSVVALLLTFGAADFDCPVEVKGSRQEDFGVVYVIQGKYEHDRDCIIRAVSTAKGLGRAVVLRLRKRLEYVVAWSDDLEHVVIRIKQHGEKVADCEAA
jgi:hypothetical protein